MKKTLIVSMMIFLVSAVLSACATSRVVVHSRDVRWISDVPFYPQEDYRCGPAALASVLSYWQRGVDPSRISREIFSSSARGTLTIDMVMYAQKMGFRAEDVRGTLTALRHAIDSGTPAIVLVDYGVSLFQANHFMVVTGYTDDGLIVHSGRNRDAFIPHEKFLSAWEKAGFWMLLIRKP